MMVFAAEFFSHAISTTLGVRRLRGADARAARPAATLARRRRRPARRPRGDLRVPDRPRRARCSSSTPSPASAGRCGAPPTPPARSPARCRPRLQLRGRSARRSSSPTATRSPWSGSAGTRRSGLNSDGFFGITLPRWDAFRDLLFAGRGLLVLTPVLVMAVVGIVLMRRRGHRAEAWTIAAVAIAYFVYNVGYWQPFGGGTPGPRFLIPALPFVALGLAFAYRRFPATTLALAIPSGIWMVAARLTYPLLGDPGDRSLGHRPRQRDPRAHRAHGARRAPELARRRSRCCSRSAARSPSPPLATPRTAHRAPARHALRARRARRLGRGLDRRARASAATR